MQLTVLGLNSFKNIVGVSTSVELLFKPHTVEKGRYRFCDVDGCRYTLNELQHISSLQVITFPQEKSTIAKVRTMRVCFVLRKKIPMEKIPMKKRAFTTFSSSEYSTVGISLSSEISLPNIVMGKTRSILIFQDQTSTYKNLFIFLQDKLCKSKSMN